MPTSVENKQLPQLPGSHPPQSKVRRVPVMSPPRMSSLPVHSDDRSIIGGHADDFVEELATTPTFGSSLGDKPIILATDFGHISGRRMSVAPQPKPGQGPGDDLPGAKARKVLGIKTSSGFDDGEAEQDGVGLYRANTGSSSSSIDLPLSRTNSRSASPSIFSSVSSIVRRSGSIRSHSNSSSSAELHGDGALAGRASCDAGPSLSRKPSIGSVLGRTNSFASQMGQRKVRKSFDDATNNGYASLPQYTKARGVDAQAASKAGWSHNAREHDQDTTAATKVPRKAVPSKQEIGKPDSLRVQIPTSSANVHSSASQNHGIATEPSTLAGRSERTKDKAVVNQEHEDAKQLYELATLEFIFSNSNGSSSSNSRRTSYSPASSASSVERRSKDDSRRQRRMSSFTSAGQSPSPEGWSQETSSDVPSLVGHSDRSGSPSSLWSIATGSSMSLEAALGGVRPNGAAKKNATAPTKTDVKTPVQVPGGASSEFGLLPPALLSTASQYPPAIIPPASDAFGPPSHRLKTAASKSAKGSKFAISGQPTISWPHTNVSRGKVQMIRSHKDLQWDGAKVSHPSMKPERPLESSFLQPRRAPEPPSVRLAHASTVKDMPTVDGSKLQAPVPEKSIVIGDLDEDAEEAELARLDELRRSRSHGERATERNVCDDVVFVLSPDNAFTQTSTADAAEGGAPQFQYALRAPADPIRQQITEQQQKHVSADAKSPQRVPTDEAAEDLRIQSVLQADSPEALRLALGAQAEQLVPIVEQMADGPSQDAPAADVDTTEAIPKPPALAIIPPLNVIGRSPSRRVKIDGALYPRKSLIAPVDVDNYLSPSSFVFDTQSNADEGDDAESEGEKDAKSASTATSFARTPVSSTAQPRLSVDEAFNSIILDLPSPAIERRSFHAPPKSPLRKTPLAPLTPTTPAVPRARYALPIG